MSNIFRSEIALNTTESFECVTLLPFHRNLMNYIKKQALEAEDKTYWVFPRIIPQNKMFS